LSSWINPVQDPVSKSDPVIPGNKKEEAEIFLYKPMEQSGQVALLVFPMSSDVGDTSYLFL
jgi:hypothetical protein